MKNVISEKEQNILDLIDLVKGEYIPVSRKDTACKVEFMSKCNNWIKEMSEAAWLPGGPYDYNAYKAAFKDMQKERPKLSLCQRRGVKIKNQRAQINSLTKKLSEKEVECAELRVLLENAHVLNKGCAESKGNQKPNLCAPLYANIKNQRAQINDLMNKLADVKFECAELKSNLADAKIALSSKNSDIKWLHENKTQYDPLLVTLIDNFRGEFPPGFQSLVGYSRVQFNRCVSEMSRAEWLRG